MILPPELKDTIKKEKKEEEKRIKKIINKIIKREKKKEKKKEQKSSEQQQQPELKYVLISISGPDRISIKTVRPEELPTSISKKYAVEIVDEATGNRFIGFLVYEHQLESLIEMPLIEDFLEQNKYLPIDVRSLYNIKTEEIKSELYKSFEIATAGKWARIVYDKSLEFKPKGETKVPWWVIILLIAGGIFLFIMLSGGFSFFGGGGTTTNTTQVKANVTTNESVAIATQTQEANVSQTNITVIPIE